MNAKVKRSLIALGAIALPFALLFGFAAGPLEASSRFAELVHAKHTLKSAYLGYLETGYVTNQPDSDYTAQLSDRVITIDGSVYHCFVEIYDGPKLDGGRFAMTTNEVMIWIDPRREPKLITSGYRPKMFSRRY